MKAQDTVRKFVDGASKVKLPGGIVGKTCYVLISVCGAGAAITWASKDRGVAYAALTLVGVIVLFGLWRMFNFAEAHPEVAILEGAEFVRLREMEIGQKGKGTIRVTESESSDGADLALTRNVTAAIEIPDPEVSEESKQKRRRS